MIIGACKGKRIKQYLTLSSVIKRMEGAVLIRPIGKTNKGNIIYQVKDWSTEEWQEAASRTEDDEYMDEVPEKLSRYQWLDMFTASAIKAVYSALSKESQAKFDRLPLQKVVEFTWKQVK